MSLCSPRRFHHAVASVLFSLILCLPSAHSQAISTNMPVPPLQWINLTPLLSGSPAAPPLKDATIGYDTNLDRLVIFGGESQQGFPTAQTYILDLRSMRWVTPDTALGSPPPGRAAAIGGDDTAANYRHGHIVINGRTSDTDAASDVWEFDFGAEFWSKLNISPGGPSARWGAVGGIDTRTQPVVSPDSPYPNNSFYFAGGYDGKTLHPLSDVWRLDVTGVLSSNNVDKVDGSWHRVDVSQELPARAAMAGAMVGQQIVAIGGCSSVAATSNAKDASCAVQDTRIIDASTGNARSIPPCPAARVDATVALNFNLASSSYLTQAFLILGTFNESMWDDGGGLQKGEVSVLDVGTGAWARVLPAGDPGSDGKPTYPSPRQGAATVSVPTAVGGDKTKGISDIIVFGGRDAKGNYLSDVWLLRTYNAELTASNQKWSGFGDGQLTTGIDATGAGVTIQYMSQCAKQLAPIPDPSQDTPPDSNTPPGSKPPQSAPAALYDTSVTHKALAPISVALFLPAIVLWRLPLFPAHSEIQADRQIGLLWLGVIAGVAAYAVGIVALATAFTTITTTTATLAKRSAASSLNLQTAHGKAGLALFACFYGVVPLLSALALFRRRAGRASDDDTVPDGRHRADSATLAEKMSLASGRARSPTSTAPSERKGRIRSWAGIGTWAGVVGRPSAGRPSMESAVTTQTQNGASSAPQRSFEVTNRPARQRRASGNSLAAFSDPRPSHSPRNLSDVSWMDRRPSLSGQDPDSYGSGNRGTTPGLTTPLDVTSTNGLMMASSIKTPPQLPPPLEGVVHVVAHLLLLALSGLSLAALWQRAPPWAFAVFLVWVLIFYFILIILAWRGHPHVSILAVVFSRLRAEPAEYHSPARAPSPVGSRPLSVNESVGLPFPSESRGPYTHHQPAYRATLSPAHDHEHLTSLSHSHEHEEDDEDEDARQQRIEGELNRRDVSIVTVPKRRLFLLNPNPPDEEGGEAAR